MTIKFLILKLLEYRILIAADWEKAEQRTEEQSWGETDGVLFDLAQPFNRRQLRNLISQQTFGDVILGKVFGFKNVYKGARFSSSSLKLYLVIL